MIRVSGTVTLVGGERVPFAGGPREFAAWERFALSHNLPPTQNASGGAAGLTMMWFLAYACVSRGAAERVGFDAWLDTLVDLSDFELSLPPPTRSEASDEPLDSSPPRPESDPETSGMPTHETSQPSWQS